MAMYNPCSMAWENHVEPPVITSVRNDHLQMGQGSHILEFTDSSSTIEWIHKASFDPLNAESYNAVSRWIVCTLVSNETSLYSQHIKVTEK